jgi:predicted nicotinamide N-methyase
MNSLSSLLVLSIPSETVSAQQKSYVTYTISSLPAPEGRPATITLLESRNMVAASGMTGLRTWEAALHLGNYLCENTESLIRGKSILELGTGTGYVSILCSKHLGASHVLATDGSEDVISSLSTNIYLNGLQDSSKIEAKELRWGWALTAGEHSEWNGGRKIDLVLGADLTYDGTGISALVGTFNDLCELNPELTILYAAPMRNEKTFEKFMDACRRNNYVVDEIKLEMMTADKQLGPFYSDKVPIQLSRITRSK